MFLEVPRAELGDVDERLFWAAAQTHIVQVPFMLCWGDGRFFVCVSVCWG